MSSIPNDVRLSNPQVALICATDMDPGAYRTPDGDERTQRVVARAHQFLAFLESADEDIRDLPQTRHDEAIDNALARRTREAVDHAVQNAMAR